MASNVVLRKAKGVARRLNRLRKRVGEQRTEGKPGAIEVRADRSVDDARVEVNVIRAEGEAFGQTKHSSRLDNQISQVFRPPQDTEDSDELSDGLVGVIHSLKDAAWDLGVSFERISSLDEYNRQIAKVGVQRAEVERHMGAAHLDQERWFVSGYCQACQTASNFVVGWEYSDHVIPNYREHLVCPGCGLNNRQRFVASALVRLVGEASSDVYLYEQVTPMYQWAKSHLANCSVTGSEYLGPAVAPGSIINGIRHEDALNLTFPSQSLDIIVSTDVYEHVPDIEKTIAEALRVLRPGGKLLFSVPFFVTEQKTIQRAELRPDGQIHHHHPPHYHGNPISLDEGSLVFFDYGWDLLDLFKRVGFTDVYVLAYYNWLYGYIGDGLQLFFVAER